ncbi:MAG: hypothetical protein CMD83_08385 [Gammaproteobacteria bacterium]|nr:hypothetical protein [Gammaproteobacteria bacterium]MBS03618.1 hypothetical protein [Gammaproteobacteria bacterium]|tara:strand:- start:1725 stop:2213 length:489 start_codon:yes stop_codon:yes gene_type:complete
MTKTWLAGILAFCSVYCAIVMVMLVLDWPSIVDPKLRTTLEFRLEPVLRERVHVVVKGSPPIDNPTVDHTFEVRKGAFTGDGASLDTVDMLNRHRIVLTEGTTSEQASAIGEAYTELVFLHIQQERLDVIIRGLAVIVIPMALIALFGWIFRALYVRIRMMH